MATATETPTPTAREARYQEDAPRPLTQAEDDKLILFSFAAAVDIAKAVITAGQDKRLPEILEGYREAVVYDIQGEIAPFYDALADEKIIAVARAGKAVAV